MKEQNYIEEDEITLKELILKVKEFFQEVLKNWMLIVLITIPFVLYFFYQTYNIPNTYPATLTFMLNEDKGSSIGGLGGLAASLGFGSGGNSEYNLDKMHSLLKSRNIIQRAIFEKTTINKENNFVANHLIKMYDFHELWKEDVTGLNNFVYTHNKIEEFNRIEYRVLKILYGKLIGSEDKKGILGSSINDETGVMSMYLEANNEELSIKLLKILFENLSDFYVNKTIEKQKLTFEITKQKVDSIRQVMNDYQFQLLKIKDTQRNSILYQSKAKELTIKRELQALTLGYGEALKNQEIANFALKSKTPFIQPIDLPIPPLSSSKDSRVYKKNLIIGGFLGSFLAIIFIIGRKVIRDAMDT